MAKTIKKKLTRFLIFFVSLLAALAIGFQNAVPVVDLLLNGSVWNSTLLIVFGATAAGFCATAVNFFINIDLLTAFKKRLTGEKPFPVLGSFSAKLAYWLGISAFIVSGICLALMAFTMVSSVPSIPFIGILAFVTGIFVAIMTIPQELETWLSAFDNDVLSYLAEIEYKIKNSEDGKKKLKKKIAEICFTIQKKTIILRLQHVEDKRKLTGEDTNEIHDVLEGLKNATTPEQLKNVVCHFSQSLCDMFTKHQKMLCEQEGLLTTLQEHATDQTDEAVQKKVEDLIAQLKALEKTARLAQSLSIGEQLKKWALELTVGRVIGLVITVGNVAALALLFGISFATFLLAVGVAAFPALISGCAVGFTVGSFTQFRFYQGFLTDFCDDIKEKWKKFIHSPKWGLGIITILINASVNGVLSFTGVMLLENLLLSVGLTVPSLFILAIVFACFAGLASLLLCSSFWIDNVEKIAGGVKKYMGKVCPACSGNAALPQQKEGADSEKKSLLEGMQQETDNQPTGFIVNLGRIFQEASSAHSKQQASDTSPNVNAQSLVMI